MFQSHKTFFYFDSSVRLQSKLEYLVGVKAHHILPITLYTRAVHSVYAAVHPGKSLSFQQTQSNPLGMLEYLPLTKTILYLPELEGNNAFFSDSAFTRYMFKWLD
jgi:hypothetical protein